MKPFYNKEKSSEPKAASDTSGLCLTRREGEEVWVEHGLLKIQIARIRGREVRLRFIGNVAVHRAEVLMRDEEVNL